MSYQVKPCSELASQQRVPVFDQRLKSWRKKRDWQSFQPSNKKFPFKRMLVGQSFYMQYEEVTLPDLAEAKNRMRWINLNFKVRFMMIKRNTGIEFIRLF